MFDATREGRTNCRKLTPASASRHTTCTASRCEVCFRRNQETSYESPKFKDLFNAELRWEDARVNVQIDEYCETDIGHRAARVRAAWSHGERLRRFGLPPDIPWRLRQCLAAFRAEARQSALARR